MAVILAARNISKEFAAGRTGAVRALSGVSADVEEGRVVCFRGRSGSGKTTLVNILGALDMPTEGSVMFGGEDITALSEAKRDRLRRYEMAFVFQSVALIGSMTAFENVELALRLAGVPAGERARRVSECLARVGLEKRSGHRPAELSGGEQQRVAIARAICHNPKVIFADEPTAELDTVTGLAVMRLFRDLVKEGEFGRAIVMTTHDEAMMESADVTYTLEDGEITSVDVQR
ncbi:MAG: ABC transporter ATP-binding protein [Oscillospiraceae bacterium]|jgi:putative ABC transport system ATP-binding protein|nr:ABC transporter ATP-binding protein [Oscillospiraceae bacterium]